MKCTHKVTKTLIVRVYDEGLDDAELSIQSVMGPDGLREFIMLPIWTVNDFTSTIKESHFKTLREKYQIPTNIPFLSTLLVRKMLLQCR